MKGWTVFLDLKPAARIRLYSHAHITLATQETYAQRTVAYAGRKLKRKLRLEWTDDLDWRLPCLADLVGIERPRAG